MKDRESDQETDSEETIPSLSDSGETILKFYFIKPYRTRPGCNFAREENKTDQLGTSEKISSAKKSPSTAETRTIKSEREAEIVSPCKTSASSDSSNITSLEFTTGDESSKPVSHLETPRSLESLNFLLSITSETAIKSECKVETVSPCKTSTSSDSSIIPSLEFTSGDDSSKPVPHSETPRTLESLNFLVPITSETAIKSECKVKTVYSCKTSASSDSSTTTSFKSIADKSSKSVPLVETPSSLESLNFSESYGPSMKVSESTKCLEDFLVPTGHFLDPSASVSVVDPSVPDTCFMNPSASDPCFMNPSASDPCFMNPSASDPPLESSILRSFASGNPSVSTLSCVKYAATTTILESSESATSFDKSAMFITAPKEPSAFAANLAESSVFASSIAKSSESIVFLMESSTSSIESDSSSESLHLSGSHLSEKISEYTTSVETAASALKMEHPSASSSSFVESSVLSCFSAKSNVPSCIDLFVAPSSSMSLNPETIEPSVKLSSESTAPSGEPPEEPETYKNLCSDVYSGGARPKNRHSIRSQNVSQPTVPTIEAEDNMTEIVRRFFLRYPPSEIKFNKNKAFAENRKLFTDDFADHLGIPRFNEAQQNLENAFKNESSIEYISSADRFKAEIPFEKWNWNVKGNLPTRTVPENFEGWTRVPDFRYAAGEFVQDLPGADNENNNEIPEADSSNSSRDPFSNKMFAYIKSLLKETHGVASPFVDEPSIPKIPSSRPLSPSQLSIDVHGLMKETRQDFSYDKVHSKIETIMLRMIRESLAEADISDEDLLQHFPSAMQITDQEDNAEKKPSDFSKVERILNIVYKYGYKNVAAVYSEIKNARRLKRSQKLYVKDNGNEEGKNLESSSTKSLEEKPEDSKLPWLEDSRPDFCSSIDPGTKFEESDITPVHASSVGKESFGHYFNISSTHELNPLKNPSLLTSPSLNKNKAISPLKQKILDAFDGIPTHTSPINLRDVLGARRNSCSVTEESEIERDSFLDPSATNVSEKASHEKNLLSEFSSAYRRTSASPLPSESAISTDIGTIWTHKVSSGRSKLLEIIQNLKEGENITNKSAEVEEIIDPFEPVNERNPDHNVASSESQSSAAQNVEGTIVTDFVTKTSIENKSAEVEEIIDPFEPVNERNPDHNVASGESQSSPAQNVEGTIVTDFVTKSTIEISSVETKFKERVLQTITKEQACQMDSSVIICDPIEMSEKETERSHSDPKNRDEASGLDMSSGETSNQSCVKAHDVLQTFTSELDSNRRTYSRSTSQTTETTIKWFTEERTTEEEKKKVFDPLDPERLETKQVNSVSFKLDTSVKDVWETDKSFTFYKELKDKKEEND